ncbi:PorP/SprF family type IX secretion system membrane protein [Rubrolithibacter danxiaensis]|uniref:PorP/SprF family type IX secretion system membrane protein n=1 Tax=Rubrolithibacter danxiaensis TaxID=3390805 RepID=UPI003BF858D6
MRRTLSILFCFWAINGFAQQQAMFSQYMFNGLLINPAYSSLDETLNIKTLYRRQWTSFEGAPNTQTFSIHAPIKASNTSVGIIMMRDQIGEVINDKTILLTAAQRVKVASATYLNLGINFGVSKYSASYTDVADFDTSIDPVFTDQNNLRSNIGFGVLLFSKRYFVGFSSPFFHSKIFQDNSNPGTPSFRPHYLLAAAYLLDIGESFKLKPNTLIKYVSGAPVQVDLNINLLIKERVWIGASWRSFDSFDFLTQIEFLPGFQIGYAYDFTTSDLFDQQKGSHEIMLNYRIPLKGRSFPRCYF